jgi:hypothetical protein
MRDTIHHPLLLALFDYWETLRAGRALPRRADFDPFKLPRLLPSLIVNEVERGPDGSLRFRIRLEGENVVQARGRSARGRYIDEPGIVVLGQGVIEAYKRMVADRKPWYSEGTFRPDALRSGSLHRLALPFAGDDPERVDFIVVGFIHDLRPIGKQG